MTTKVSTNMLNQTGNLNITADNVSLGAIANVHITGGTSGTAYTQIYSVDNFLPASTY